MTAVRRRRQQQALGRAAPVVEAAGVYVSALLSDTAASVDQVLPGEEARHEVFPRETVVGVRRRRRV